jgi:thioredoxin reductase (NADPH)
MAGSVEAEAFPVLTDAEREALRGFASAQEFGDGETIFRAGDAELDLLVVEEGNIEIQNPTDDGRVVATHRPGGFAGDIDLLTGRPVIVTAVARGRTRVLRVPFGKIRMLLNRVPSLGERLIVAWSRRRELLTRTGRLGLRVVGGRFCKGTNLVREFLYKNFVPFIWYDANSPEGKDLLAAWGDPSWPAIGIGDGEILVNPPLRDLAGRLGIWRACPEEEVDLAIIGAGPAGIAAGVYAASEGLSTLLLDRLGPGGQAGGSSKIENFIGFPAGLSGTELATRGVLQLLKFGARIVAPVAVERLRPSASPGEPHRLDLDCGVALKARVVLLATGVTWRRLAAEGVERFEGTCVHYACTSVEALLYDASDVAVIGGGNSAGQAAVYLSTCCPGRTVHLLVRGELGPGMSDYLVGRIRAAANIVVHEGTEVHALLGGRRLEALDVRTRGREGLDRLPCAAVFVFIGAEPSAEWLPTEVARDEKGYVLTGSDATRSGRWPLGDRDPCPLETTVPGILAAGDLRAGSTKRVGFAVGDGSLAVTCAHRLLSIRQATAGPGKRD